jgi:hypothetical protein
VVVLLTGLHFGMANHAIGRRAAPEGEMRMLLSSKVLLPQWRTALIARFSMTPMQSHLSANQAIPFRRSLKLHNESLAGAASPLILLAPSLRFGPKRYRALAKASFTNSLLPITAPAVK